VIPNAIFSGDNTLHCCECFASDQVTDPIWVHGSRWRLATMIRWHLFLVDMWRQGASKAPVPDYKRYPPTFGLNDLADLVYKKLFEQLLKANEKFCFDNI